jgi:hypothetical protein
MLLLAHTVVEVLVKQETLTDKHTEVMVHHLRYQDLMLHMQVEVGVVKHLTFHKMQALVVLVAEVQVQIIQMVLAVTALLIKAVAEAAVLTHQAVMTVLVVLADQAL